MSSSLLLSVSTLILIIPSLSSNTIDMHSACTTNFTCGDITAGYPFWGQDRTAACGFSDMELKCQNDDTIIGIDSVMYTVLEINENDQILRIARRDYADGSLCQPVFVNTTLDSSRFELVTGYKNLTIIYGCPSGIVPAPFNCDIKGSPATDVYAVWDAYGPGLCYQSVVVPVKTLTWSTDLFNLSFLQVSLQEGFEVKWKVDEEVCNQCVVSGGACGRDLETNLSTCYCPDRVGGSESCRSSPETVRPEPGKKSSSNSLGIGLGVAGGAVIVIGIACWVLIRIQKRKRIAARAQSNELPASPLNKGKSAPVTNYSLTTASYLSSKSDPEKGSTYFGAQVFSYDELLEATDNFDPSKELGDGGFGTVYYGVLNDGRVVAVKRLFENNVKRAEQFMNEIEILTRLRHKNLVTLYGCTSKHSRELILVYEYIPNGTIADHIHGNKSKSGLVPWKVRLSMAIETADALAYLHASDVIHRDVKTNNILLDNNYKVKVADFGLSRLYPNDATHVSTAPQGTPGYVDPDYYQYYQLTDKSDVYSFGVVLIELISSLQAVDTTRHRLDINLSHMAVKKIQNHKINELVDPMLGFDRDYAVRRMTTAVAELAFRCLQQEREMRPTMAEVLAALRKIESENYGSEKAGALDVKKDDAVLLNHVSACSPDESIPTAKWISSSSVTSTTSAATTSF